MTGEADDNSLAGQLWSDDPATVGFLAAEAIAATVTDALLDNALDPLSLGLSGPWAAARPPSWRRPSERSDQGLVTRSALPGSQS